MGRHTTPPPDIRVGAVAVAAILFAMTTGLAVAGHENLLRDIAPAPATSGDAATRVSTTRFEGCRPAAGCDRPMTAQLISRTSSSAGTAPAVTP